MSLPYCRSLYTYSRRPSREVSIGGVAVGGDHPIRVQSMITCDTMDTAACIAQTLELVAVGCEIVRITAPTVKDAANLQHIVAGLRARGCEVPIVADIHFKPEAAMEAAKWVEKVRINPGNYADSKKFEDQRIHRRAIRRGTGAHPGDASRRWSNFARSAAAHAHRHEPRLALSDRIMNRYGDTPLGMVESALEFARIARELDYHDFMFSMKSSNPKVMIEAYRLLVARLARRKVRIGITRFTSASPRRRRRGRPHQERHRHRHSALATASATPSAFRSPRTASMKSRWRRRWSRPQRAIRRTARDSPIWTAATRMTRFLSTSRDSHHRGRWHEARRRGVGSRRRSAGELRQDRAQGGPLGDYQPEIIYEKAGIREVDPTNDIAIEAINGQTHNVSSRCAMGSTCR